MTRIRPASALKVTALGALLGLLAFGLWSRQAPRIEPLPAGGEVTVPPPRAANPRPAAARAAGTSAPLPMPAPVDAPPETSAYAIVLAGVAKQTPQALAKARMLGSLCVGSYGLLLSIANAPPGDWRSTAAGVRGPLPALPGETPQISAQRQQALELLHRHCDPVMQDADAMNRDEVRLPLRSQPPHFVKDLQAQLAARSYLEIGTTLISGRATPIAYFDGAPWGGVGPEAFVLAVHLATWMDPQPVGRMAAQLDVAIHCLRHGRCTADEVTLHALGDDTRPSPETLARARALAPRLFAAMQAGRVDPFLPPSAPKP